MSKQMTKGWMDRQVGKQMNKKVTKGWMDRQVDKQ